MFIEKDESTASRRVVPFRVFLSNGTAPDTGVSNDTVMGSINGLGQFSLGSASAISANAGMYYCVPSQSNVSTLGTLAVWYDLGDFAQHVANVQIVNFNPFSNFSNIAAKAYSGVSFEVTTGGIQTSSVGVGTYSGVTIQGLTNYSNLSGSLSGLTIRGIENYSNLSGNLSGVTIQGFTNFSHWSGNYSAFSVRLMPVDYSSAVTVGIGIAQPSRITVRLEGALTYSDVSFRLDSGAIPAAAIQSGAITAAKFAAGAIDAAALATDAGAEIADAVLDRDMSTGVDSGTSAIRTARNALRALRNRVASDATQLYVYGEDDTTIKWTASLATVASTNNHISGFDPNS